MEEEGETLCSILAAPKQDYEKGGAPQCRWETSFCGKGTEYRSSENRKNIEK